jgi:hypothetical protein
MQANPTTDDVGSTALAANIKAFFAAAMSGVKAEEDGRAAWCENTLNLGKALLQGRELHQNDCNAFHAWLVDNELGESLLSHQDRSALIRMAEHAEIAERVLAATRRRSWRLIWDEEIWPEVENKRGVTSAGNPAGKQAPNRGGRPSKKSVPQYPLDHITPLKQRIVEQFAGGRPVSVDKVMSRLNAARVNVETALAGLGPQAKRLADGAYEMGRSR